MLNVSPRAHYFFRSLCAAALVVTLALPFTPAYAETAPRSASQDKNKKSPHKKTTKSSTKSSAKKSARPGANLSAEITRSPKYASLVMDEKTGSVLSEKNARESRYPASLTKIMTLYLTFDALKKGSLDMGQRLVVSEHAAQQAPSKLNLQPGDSITARDAIMALIIKSANDVAVVLAENIGGSEPEFAERMTRTAHSLGMNDTNFVNASGLHHPAQKTTAYDLAKLAMAVRRDFPEYYPLFSRTGFNYRGNFYPTHNRVVQRYDGAEGLKTGFTQPSGFNLVTTAKRNGERVVAVVLGGPTAKARDQHMISLLDRGFQLVKNIRSSVAGPGTASSSVLSPLAPAPELASPFPVAPAPFLLQQNVTSAALPVPRIKPIDALLYAPSDDEEWLEGAGDQSDAVTSLRK